jgi:hypothetical protein
MLFVSNNKCILFSLLIWARIVEFGLFDLNKVILKEECDFFFIESTVNLSKFNARKSIFKYEAFKY